MSSQKSAYQKRTENPLDKHERGSVERGEYVQDLVDTSIEATETILQKVERDTRERTSRRATVERQTGCELF